MSEKLIESITFKCTYEEKRDLEAIARSENKTLSEYVRGLCITNISVIRERLQNLATLMRMTTDTEDTAFELMAEPLVKTQAIKKANCCDQLTLISVNSDK